ncbi:MAG: 1-phosphofructokinase family hexose kinase [Clostridia bacterium]|nr:1-phosphofructokinase family hexose kinase [Clostridia bacterium]
MNVATLTLNPCIDKTLYFNTSFRTDGLNRAAYSVTSAGGKGINVARIYRKLGIRVQALGFAGGTTGDMLRALLEKEDIQTNFVETLCDTRMCIKLIDATGVCTEANECGGPIQEEEYKALKAQLVSSAHLCSSAHSNSAEEDIILFAGGSIPNGLPDDTYKQLIKELSSLGTGHTGTGKLRFILDADGAALREGITASPWLIKPNCAELSGLIGYEITGRTALEKAENAAKASRRIHAQYGTNVLCTLGGDGAVYTNADGAYYVNAPHVTMRGFTGAGDTFLASFVFAYEKNGSDVESALCFASSAAAAKVELAGTEMPDKQAMMRFAEKVQAEKLSI